MNTAAASLVTRSKMPAGKQLHWAAMSLMALVLLINLEGPDPGDALLIPTLLLTLPILYGLYARIRLSRTAVGLMSLFVASYFLSIVTGGANVSFVANLLLNVGFLACVVAGLRTPAAAKQWIWLLSLGYTVCGLVAGLQNFIGFGMLPGQFEIVRHGRFMAMYGDPNMLGALSIFIFIYWLNELVAVRQKTLGETVTATVFLLSAATQLLTSQSRSAWLGLVLALLVYSVLNFRLQGLRALKRMTAATTVMVAAIAVFLSVTDLGQNLMNRLFTVSEQDTAAEEERFGFFYTLAAIAVATENPLGVGPGMTSAATGIQSVDGDAIGAHNAFVQIFADNGWIAGIVFGIAVVSMLFLALKAAWHGRSGLGVSAAVIASTLIGLMACGMFQDLIQWRLIWIVPSIFVSMWIHDRPRLYPSSSTRGRKSPPAG